MLSTSKKKTKIRFCCSFILKIFQQVLHFNVQIKYTHILSYLQVLS